MRAVESTFEVSKLIFIFSLQAINGKLICPNDARCQDER